VYLQTCPGQYPINSTNLIPCHLMAILKTLKRKGKVADIRGSFNKRTNETKLRLGKRGSPLEPNHLIVLIFS
jgi:hypothetical protein